MTTKHTPKRPRHRPAWQFLLVAAGLTFSIASPALAQWDFGIRGGLYTEDSDPFVGIEGLTRMGASRWYFNPNFEAVFVDNGDLFTVNGDFHYDFEPSGSVDFWAGGGPALIFRDFDRGRFGRGNDTETDLGLDLLAGLGFNPRASVRPYFQAKLILSDDTEGVVAFGVRF
jgi:hypothetical protein